MGAAAQPRGGHMRARACRARSSSLSVYRLALGLGVEALLRLHAQRFDLRRILSTAEWQSAEGLCATVLLNGVAQLRALPLEQRVFVLGAWRWGHAGAIHAQPKAR